MSCCKEHSSKDRIPYTYLVGWSWLDTWYYGVSFREGCHPDKFWKEEKRSKQSYNTSSEYVDRFVEEHGQPDVHRVDCIFETTEAARDYESLMIETFDMVKDLRFLNKHDPKGRFFHTEPHSEESKQKIRESHQARTALGLNPLQKRADGTSMSSDRTALGLNPFSIREDGSSIGQEVSLKRVIAGTHPWLTREDGSSVAQEAIHARIAAGTFINPWLTREDGSSVGRDTNEARVIRKTHPWLKQNQVKKECPVCHKMVDPANMAKHHGDRCGQPVPRKECPVCHKMVDPANMAKHHGIRCKSNSNRKENKG